jgi:predicted nucleotidyltransferase
MNARYLTPLSRQGPSGQAAGAAQPWHPYGQGRDTRRPEVSARPRSHLAAEPVGCIDIGRVMEGESGTTLENPGVGGPPRFAMPQPCPREISPCAAAAHHPSR